MGYQTIIFTVILALCVVLSYIAGRLDDKRRASRKIAELEKTLELSRQSQQIMFDCLNKVKSEMKELNTSLLKQMG